MLRAAEPGGDWTAAPAPAVVPPRPGPASLPRPRVVDRISRSVATARITQVIGPAGFGKTTALAEWCGSTDLATAWLSLDEDCHNDQRLYSRLVLALAQCAERHPVAGLRRLQELSVRAQDSQVQRLALVQVLEELESDLVLVVDDAHAVAPLRHGGALAGLLRLRTDRVRVVLGSRSVLKELARQTLSGEAVTIGPADLAFTADEVARVARLLGHDLTADRAEAVAQQTQGWPAGVRLALLSPDDAGRPDRRHSSWSPAPGPGAGHPQLLADYVEDEVLARLPEGLAQFLLDVTTCDEVDPRLALHLSGQPDTAGLLDQAVRHGLFVQRTTVEDRVLYRWHPLFATACRAVLGARNPHRQAALHRVAARRLASTDPLRAARHAVAGDDPAQAWSVLASSWSTLLVHGDAAAVETLCAQLPDAWQQDPLVMLVRACAGDLLGDRHGAQTMLRAAAARIETEGAGVDPSTLPAFAMARLMVQDDPGSLAGACDELARFLEAGEPSSRSLRNAAQFLLGWTEMRLRRNPARAVLLLESARQAARVAGDRVLAERAETNLAFANAYAGRFRRACELLGRSAGHPGAMSGWVSYDGGIGSFTAGFTDYWRDELVSARRQLTDVLVHGGDASYGALARVFLARIAAASGDPREIAQAEAHLREIASSDVHGLPWQVYRTATGALLAAANGQLQRAVQLCEALPPTSHVPVITVDVAAIHLQAGDLATAARTLTALTPLEEQPTYVRVGALLLNALVQCRRGHQQSAHRLVESAMALASPEDIARPFRLRLPGLRRLLLLQAETGTDHPEWLAARIAGIDQPPDGSPAAHLSRREREVLSYLRGTLTTAEIADALHVSVNTVKTHQRLIYRKLGVSSRREAVALTTRDNGQ